MVRAVLCCHDIVVSKHFFNELLGWSTLFEGFINEVPHNRSSIKIFSFKVGYLAGCTNLTLLFYSDILKWGCCVFIFQNKKGLKLNIFVLLFSLPKWNHVNLSPHLISPHRSYSYSPYLLQQHGEFAKEQFTAGCTFCCITYFPVADSPSLLVFGIDFI